METSGYGLRYRLSVPNYLAVRAMDRWFPAALASGRLPGLEYSRMQPRELLGPDWLRLRPILSGICGSDLALLTGQSSPALSPFTSFPAILGHEVVAEVIEVGAAVEHVSVGDRVVIDPFISCEMRGLEPCEPCQNGQHALCTNAAEGQLSPGMLIGFCRDLPGGWSTDMVVHRSQVYQVPPELTDEAAVLVEPLSIGLHAVLRLPPRPGSHVLIIGGGTVGLAVLAALRLLNLDCHVTITARYPFQAEMARKLGADAIHRSAETAAVEVAHARKYHPLRGADVYAGGFDAVYDCVGSARSVDESLRVAGPDAQVTLVGCAGELSRLDLTFVWAHELRVTGSYGYGQEDTFEGKPHTFELTLALLKDRPDFPVAELVTHRFPLANWREAMRVTLGRSQHGAIKTVFDCRVSG